MYRLIQIQSFWVDRKGGINFQEYFNLKLKQILSLNYFVESQYFQNWMNVFQLNN